MSRKANQWQIARVTALVKEGLSREQIRVRLGLTTHQLSGVMKRNGLKPVTRTPWNLAKLYYELQGGRKR